MGIVNVVGIYRREKRMEVRSRKIMKTLILISNEKEKIFPENFLREKMGIGMYEWQFGNGELNNEYNIKKREREDARKRGVGVRCFKGRELRSEKENAFRA